VISLNLILAELRLGLKNRQVGEKWVSDDCSYLCKGLELAANSLCLLILWRYRNEDINMTSIGGCSKNDIMRPLHK
jgi:hypothetical protein